MNSFFLEIMPEIICIESDSNDEIIIVGSNVPTAKKPKQPKEVKNDEIMFISEEKSTSSTPNSSNPIQIIPDPPQPIRFGYPHYDNNAQNRNLEIEKCPICHLKFKKFEISRHVPECKKLTFSKVEIRGEFKVKIGKDGKEEIIGRADKDPIHKSFLPSKNRRVLKPKF